MVNRPITGVDESVARDWGLGEPGMRFFRSACSQRGEGLA